jgi:hypothetical protein
MHTFLRRYVAPMLFTLAGPALAGTIPLTAASFSTDALPAQAGTIDLWAKLSGYSGVIPWGASPYLFVLSDDSRSASYSLGFNGNDGLGDGGLVAGAGANFSTGSDGYGWVTFEDVLGADAVDAWHHYTLKWSENGLPEVNGAKVAIAIDGTLRSARWDSNCQSACAFPDLQSGTLALVFQGSPNEGTTGTGRVAIDEFKIFDGDGKLVLYNTLDSVSDLRHSVVGLNATFDGYGNPAFVPGVVGNALEATPVWAYVDGPDTTVPVIPEPATSALLSLGLMMLAWLARRRHGLGHATRPMLARSR